MIISDASKMRDKKLIDFWLGVLIPATRVAQDHSPAA